MKLKTKKRMGLVFFPAFDWAISPTHPEREERLLYTQDQILEEGIPDIEGIFEFKPLIASKEDVEKVHFCVPDVAGQTTESHLISAGGAIRAAKAVLSGEVDCSFAIIRPPGHHAMRIVHGNRGFCNVNIEAIMIEYIRDTYGISRIAVIDTDCHHGDGTQDIYWHDPDILFISLHQTGQTLYPGTGFVSELGGPNAICSTINIPLQPRTGDDGYIFIVDNVILPILDEFKPELIINSAGQDNHYSDPITDMRISARGYAELSSRINPQIAVLEGGYSIESALPYVNLGIVLAMSGMDFSNVREPDYDEKKLKSDKMIMDYTSSISSEIMQIWKKRNKLKSEIIHNSDWHIRRRQIFYDTDGITENQFERLKICKECCGFLVIDSSADNNNRILAIHIPLGACKKCQEEAKDLFFKMKNDDYNWIYLQDRISKSYDLR